MSDEKRKLILKWKLEMLPWQLTEIKKVKVEFEIEI